MSLFTCACSVHLSCCLPLFMRHEHVFAKQSSSSMTSNKVGKRRHFSLCPLACIHVFSLTNFHTTHRKTLQTFPLGQKQKDTGWLGRLTPALSLQFLSFSFIFLKTLKKMENKQNHHYIPPPCPHHTARAHTPAACTCTHTHTHTAHTRMPALCTHTHARTHLPAPHTRTHALLPACACTPAHAHCRLPSFSSFPLPHACLAVCMPPFYLPALPACTHCMHPTPTPLPPLPHTLHHYCQQLPVSVLGWFWCVWEGQGHVLLPLVKSL